MSTGQEAERVEGELVSGNFFDALGVRPAHGRLITQIDEHGAGASQVAVLSHRLWRRRFNGDPSVIGKTIKLDGHDFTVIGVAGEGFDGTKIGAQFLTESLTLAIPGGAAGLGIGLWLTEGMRRLLPERYLWLSFKLDFGKVKKIAIPISGLLILGADNYITRPS